MKIWVDRTSDPELVTAFLIADTSEKILALDSIKSTISSFKDYLQNFSGSESSINLSREFCWGGEKVVVRAGSSKSSFFKKVKALFQR